MKKILFRADAAPHIGIGDLMSLINISKYFDRSIECFFVIRDYKAGVELAKKYDIENCFIIDKNISLQEEVKYLNNFFEEKKIDLVFFEITERKLSDYTGIKKDIKKVCVSFDGHILDGMDLVIDWDVEAYKFFDTEKHKCTRFLLGPKYVILPKEFYSDRIKTREKNKRVLIAMGGADDLDFTRKIVEVLKSKNLDIELNIIIGSGYNYKDKLEQSLKQSSLKYEIKQNITNMLEEYLSCGIGIGAGGLTASEMVATKISPILIATYEHQKARCEYFDKMGWVKYLGYRKFDKDQLIEAILNPLNPTDEYIFNTKVIVDEIKKI